MGGILSRQCGTGCGLQPSEAEPCGFCGLVCSSRSSDICNSRLIRGSNKSTTKVSSNCPLSYNLSHASVHKSSGTSPCTNRPVVCSICLSKSATRPYVWSYSYLDHMQSCHPGQALTEEDILAHAINPEEWRAVMSLEFGKKRMDAVDGELMRLKEDASMLPQGALESKFWSKLLKEGQRMTCHRLG